MRNGLKGFREEEQNHFRQVTVDLIWSFLKAFAAQQAIKKKENKLRINAAHCVLRSAQGEADHCINNIMICAILDLPVHT